MCEAKSAGEHAQQWHVYWSLPKWWSNPERFLGAELRDGVIINAIPAGDLRAPAVGGQLKCAALSGVDEEVDRCAGIQGGGHLGATSSEAKACVADA